MLAFVGITLLLFFSLVFAAAMSRREEIAANWSHYRSDPFFMFAAPLFKPTDDPRSPVQFATDNFKDVSASFMTKTFQVFLEPLMKIFSLISNTFEESTKGLIGMRTILTNIHAKAKSITEIFMRRFQRVMHSLRITFMRLYDSFEKTYGIAVSSIFAGISTFRTIHNSFFLMMTVAIIILAALVLMVIFLFFILAPVIPLILSVVGVIAATALGSGVGGMARSFCFTKGTQIQMHNGVNAPIETLEIGQITQSGARIVGRMHCNTYPDDLYELHGIHVSGSHIVYDNDQRPLHVQNHPDAQHKVIAKGDTVDLYCLITSDHKISVLSPVYGTSVLFADWEEIETMEDLKNWHQHVFLTLNPYSNYTSPEPLQLVSESALSSRTRIWTPVGFSEIRSLVPGSVVLDDAHMPTRVTGIVEIDASEIKGVVQLDTHEYASGSIWYNSTQSHSDWIQPDIVQCIQSSTAVHERWYNIFTESGTFRIAGGGKYVGVAVRDFSDIGAQKIHTTYDWVLESLNRASASAK